MSNRGTTRNEKDLGVLSRHSARRDLPSHKKLKYRLIIFINFIEFH